MVVTAAAPLSETQEMSLPVPTLPKGVWTEEGLLLLLFLPRVCFGCEAFLRLSAAQRAFPFRPCQLWFIAQLSLQLPGC